MDFVDYRDNPLPLDQAITARAFNLNVAEKDLQDVIAMLAPLGTKGEAGRFHRDHSIRVGLLASKIGVALDLDAKALFFAGLLHDVGKALVPCCTLSATTHWTAEDQVAMEQHVLDGFRLLRDRFDFSAHVIVWHHKFQTRGYPKELPAALQPFSEETLDKAREYGKLLMVADVFDAMHRVNTATGGKALTAEEIREQMLKLQPELLGDLVPRLYEKGVLR